MATCDWFQAVCRSIFDAPKKKAEQIKFVHLGPTDDADKDGVYFEALDFATKQENVLNIALTGPYGSGKSSVVKSFLKKYPRPALEISLASFASEDGADPSTLKPEIERSILQQILYRVETDTLPFSRFKRIQTPKSYAIGISTFISIGAASAWYVFSKSAEVISGKFFQPFAWSSWLNYLALFVLCLFVVRVIHSIYTTSFGLSLKSISLKDVQIAPDETNEASILNRHLDEILYFFQSTDYDLVVIEDLDRFKNTDVFITLREINALINKNEGIKRPIRFLYALRDEVFANTDRTKFFEFIVPIIPVINHSNSIDKVLEQGKRAALDGKLDRAFLRDVSRHLTDLRLIHNIFNEYAIYAANIKVDDDGGLDPNKLLAVLIYKNVLPKDFAALHNQTGTLSTVFGRYDEYVARSETELRDAIADIEAELESGEKQALRDIAELRKVYAMTILGSLSDTYHTFQLSNGVSLPLSKLAEADELDTIVSSGAITVSGRYAGSTISAPLHGLEASVDPTRSYAERKAELNRKSSEFRQDSQMRIRDLKRQLASVRTRRFNEVVRESADLIEKTFEEVKEGRELLKFLILEGHLDDTYYQYVSLFHKGRLSPNDNRFLIQIRAYSNPAPDFALDNVAEVVAAMRTEDFGHDYVLNRFIFDYLLDRPVVNSWRLAAASDFIAAHFDRCGEFFRYYYERGAHVSQLLWMLASKWPDFATIALKSSGAASHAARILAFAPEPILRTSPYVGGSLTTFLSEHTLDALDEGVEFELDRMEVLKVEVADLASIAGHPDVHSFVEERGLYRITAINIRHILIQVSDLQDTDGLERCHHTTLLSVGNSALERRIDADFATYVGEVLLGNENNTDEAIEAILDVITSDDVPLDLLERFLAKQQAIFPTFEAIPETFHAGLLDRLKIEPTWENCRDYLASGSFQPEVLTRFLNTGTARTALARLPIPSDNATAALRDFVFKNDDLALDAYRTYVKNLPEQFAAFPAIEASKMEVLIDERAVTFTPENFGSLEEPDLRIAFLVRNFAAFSSARSEFPIDDDGRASLLKTGLTDAEKLSVVSEMATSFVVAHAAAAADIGAVIHRAGADGINHDPVFIKSVVTASRPIRVQISLLNNMHDWLSDDWVLETLEGLSGPFKDIASYGKWPRIENNDVNVELATWLQTRRIISSFSPVSGGDEIRINTKKKKS